MKYLLARRLLKILRSQRPDVLHINLMRKWDCFDFRAARRLGIKTIGHMRSLSEQASVASQDIAACDTVICISKVVEQQVKDLYPDANTTLIYNGVDPALYDVDMTVQDSRHLLSLPHNKDYYLFSIGALHPRKGHESAIRALAEIRNSGLDAVLSVVGATQLAENRAEFDRLTKIALQSGVSEHVVFLGQVNEMHLVYRAADLVYALSHDGEAFGRVPIEAAFGRVPVMATGVGATPEIIQDNITGFLVGPGNIQEIKAKSIKVLTNTVLYGVIIERAEEYAHQNFRSVICAERTGALFTKLCL